MPDFNIEYFRERAACEHALALTALHPNAIAAHAELAERYDALVRDGKTTNVLSLHRAALTTRQRRA